MSCACDSLSLTFFFFYLLYMYFCFFFVFVFFFDVFVFYFFFFFFQAEDGIRDRTVTGVQTCALPIFEVTLRLLEPRWRERIAVHRDYGALPPVECDPGQLNQVFMNLLANACDAIAGTGDIWITTRADGAGVSVAIRDDGAGIPPDVLGRIFDPFFTTKDVGGGTGLGLAVSHSVVAAHGGRIDVES